MSRCRSCNALIEWVTMEGSGKSNPLDPEPVENGNVEIYAEGDKLMGRVVTDTADRLFSPPLHLSHFATCPNAQEHRKRG